MGVLFFCLTYYFLASVGVNLGYHRVLSHRSLRLPFWLEAICITLGLPAGTPVQWAGNHRFHHAHTDTPEDPHSPIHKGFWFAHCGWYIGTANPVLCFLYAAAGPFRMLFDAWHRPRSNQQFNYLAADVAKNHYYAWLSRPAPYAILMLLHLTIPIAIAVHHWGLAGFFIYWAILAWIYNIGDSIDSVSHLFGHRPEANKDFSRNSFLMGIIVLGEGWHANHHMLPWSAKHGLLPHQFDWTWQMIRFLKFSGLATKVRVPDAKTIEKLFVH